MNILEEANTLVSGERNTDYGHPADDFQKTADMWSVILGIPISTQQMALCMIAVKISRLMHKPKRDNLVDIAGYARTIEMLWERDSMPEPLGPGAMQRVTQEHRCEHCKWAYPEAPGQVGYLEEHLKDCPRPK